MRKINIAICSIAAALAPLAALADDSAVVHVEPYHKTRPTIMAANSAANNEPSVIASSEINVAPYRTTSAPITKPDSSEAVATQLNATAPAPRSDLAVMPVVVAQSASSPAVVTFDVTAHDISLHSALERWLRSKGWQLAWSIPDELPIEFQASFTGPDMKAVLLQVMQATDHMNTPSRICRHMANKVARVVARAVSCKE
jgi:hypothetical protein